MKLWFHQLWIWSKQFNQYTNKPYENKHIALAMKTIFTKSVMEDTHMLFWKVATKKTRSIADTLSV